MPTTRHHLSAVPAPAADVSAEPTGVLTIDCDECAHQHTSTCDDCVVTFLVGRRPHNAVVVDAEEARAVRLLERAGLVPGLRHELQVS